MSQNLKVISPGYAYGITFKVSDYTKYDIIAKDKNVELARFTDALKEASINLDGQDNPYFLIQKLILNDPLLKDGVNKLILEENLTAEAALNKTIKKYEDQILNSNSTYLQERVYDLKDMSQRLINILVDKKYTFPNKPFILVCDELLPSILLEHVNNIQGIISKKAGYMSHGAILARTLEIPFVTSSLEIPSNIPLVIDTRLNKIFLNPTKEQINNIKKLKKQEMSVDIIPHEGMLLLANIYGNEEIRKVKKYGFDGIGLYRTEFVFMHNNRPLTYNEQLNIYTEAVKTLGEKTFCFRTFDIGDDKQIPYLQAHKKGFLNYINNKEMFEDQIKAFINANLYGKMKIMFPMIETKEEFNYLKSWVLNIKKELNNDNSIKIGMMLETKMALEHIYDFTESDFFSIGTNDLSMQLYHLDREKVKKIPSKYIIDLQKKLKDVVNFCNKTGKELSMCGELAALPEATKLFLEIGIKNFSVSPSAFKDLNETISKYLKNIND